MQLSISLFVSYSGVPLIQGLDIDERDFSVCSGHHSIMLTADHEVNVIAQLPPPVPKNQSEKVTILNSAYIVSNVPYNKCILHSFFKQQSNMIWFLSKNVRLKHHVYTVSKKE